MAPEELRKRAIQELRDPQVYALAQPIPGAAEATAWLARRGLFSGYLSYQPPHTQDITLEWLELSGFPRGALELLPLTAPVTGALERLGARALIGSDPAPLVEAYNNGYQTIALDMSYNRAFELPGLRAASWADFTSLLQRLPLDYRQRRDPLGYPERRKKGYLN